MRNTRVACFDEDGGRKGRKLTRGTQLSTHALLCRDPVRTEEDCSDGTLLRDATSTSDAEQNAGMTPTVPTNTAISTRESLGMTITRANIIQ